MTRTRTSLPHASSGTTLPNPQRALLALLATVAVFGLLLSGCGSRTVGGPIYFDGSIRPDGIVSLDGSPPTDGSPHRDAGALCEPDTWWELVATPLESVTVLTQLPSDPGVDEGISVRLKATLLVSGCDRMAGVTPSADYDARRIHLLGYVWSYHGPAACPEVARLVPEIFVFRYLYPGLWDVVDDAYTGAPDQPLAGFGVRECPGSEDCFCDLWDGIPGGPNASCRHDCQCQWPMSCLYEGMMDPTFGGSCQLTCSTSSDCTAPMYCLMDVMDAPEGICVGTRADECAPGQPSDCPSGRVCLWQGEAGDGAYLCVPGPTDVFPGQPCAEDCDCPAGFTCDILDDTEMRSCQIQCRGNGDCPDGLACDDLGGWLVNNRVCDAFNHF